MLLQEVNNSSEFKFPNFKIKKEKIIDLFVLLK